MSFLSRRFRRVDGADLLLAGVLAVAAVGFCFKAGRWAPTEYRKAARDVYFDNDSNRVFDAETDRRADNNDRITLHPMYPFLTYPPVAVLRHVARRDPAAAVRIFHAALGGLWIAAFFLLLRSFPVPRLDALLFTGVAGSSAAFVFWAPAIETFVLGSLSLLPPLWLAAEEETSVAAHLGAGVFALGVTVTNGMASGFSALATLSRRAFIRVTLAAAVIVGIFGWLHPRVFPGSVPAMEDTTGNAAWIFSPESGGPPVSARAFFLTTMTAPEIRFIRNWRHPAWPLMTMQFGAPLTGTRAAQVATPAWIALLLLGAAALWRHPNARLRQVLVLTTLYQLLMHMVYGRETFLYAMHFLPLLVAIAALSSATRWRPLALALAVILIPFNAINNRAQREWARAYNARAATLKRVQPEIERTVRARPLSEDPTYAFRFWRDLNWR
jgi:hypothetical protein